MEPQLGNIAQSGICLGDAYSDAALVEILRHVDSTKVAAAHIAPGSYCTCTGSSTLRHRAVKEPLHHYKILRWGTILIFDVKKVCMNEMWNKTSVQGR